MSVIIEVLRSMKRSSRTPLSCPNCGVGIRRSRSPLEGWILPTRYVCEKCGYTGFLALEEEKSPAPKAE